MEYTKLHILKLYAIKSIRASVQRPIISRELGDVYYGLPYHHVIKQSKCVFSNALVTTRKLQISRNVG